MGAPVAVWGRGQRARRMLASSATANSLPAWACGRNGTIVLLLLRPGAFSPGTSRRAWIRPRSGHFQAPRHPTYAHVRDNRTPQSVSLSLSLSLVLSPSRGFPYPGASPGKGRESRWIASGVKFRLGKRRLSQSHPLRLPREALAKLARLFRLGPEPSYPGMISRGVEHNVPCLGAGSVMPVRVIRRWHSNTRFAELDYWRRTAWGPHTS
ncbi:hypothetical protein CDD83_10024 [Cordyceps sp. RAO-2017]|nr:hypothetical protein CDD83_10024 [Cordyceps sp. RAO-2017]